MYIFLADTSVIPDRTAAFTFTVVIAGIGIVLATLAVLILLFSVFGKAVSSAEKRAREKQMKESAVPVPPEIFEEKPLPVTPVQSDGIPPEIIAAISAAVYAVEGEGAKITSITKRKAPDYRRSPWAQAAVIDNTRPF